MRKEDEGINAMQETLKLKVTMDSGACKHVTHPSTLLVGMNAIPNASGKHFLGAGGETIERYGECEALLTMKGGNQAHCKWSVADTVRLLHAVSQICGPQDHDTGHHDVLFTNKRCVVVPAGVVEHIMKHVAPVAEYPREGNLYSVEMFMSGFARQGLKQ